MCRLVPLIFLPRRSRGGREAIIFRALDGLGIDDRRAGREPTARRDADTLAQVIVHPLSRSVGLPPVRPPVDGARGRKSAGSARHTGPLWVR